MCRADGLSICQPPPFPVGYEFQTDLQAKLKARNVTSDNLFFPEIIFYNQCMINFLIWTKAFPFLGLMKFWWERNNYKYYKADVTKAVFSEHVDVNLEERRGGFTWPCFISISRVD